MSTDVGLNILFFLKKPNGTKRYRTHTQNLRARGKRFIREMTTGIQESWAAR